MIKFILFKNFLTVKCLLSTNDLRRALAANLKSKDIKMAKRIETSL